MIRLIGLILMLLLNGFMFDQSVEMYFAKDFNFAVDMFAGTFLGAIAYPAAIVGWILHCFGVSVLLI